MEPSPKLNDNYSITELIMSTSEKMFKKKNK